MAASSYGEEEDEDDLFFGSLFLWRGQRRLVWWRPLPMEKKRTTYSLAAFFYGEDKDDLFDGFSLWRGRERLVQLRPVPLRQGRERLV